MASPFRDERRPTRGHRVTVRLGEAEFERISSAATRYGVAPSSLMRVAVLDAVDDTRSLPSIANAIDTAPEASSGELRELRTAINRVGANFNQLARLSNQHGTLVITEADDPEVVTSLLGELSDLLSEVRQQLGGYRR